MENKKNLEKQYESESNQNNSDIFFGRKTNHSNNEINNEININSNNVYNRGKWTEEEQNKLIEGIALHGTNWTKVQNLMKTRNEIQIKAFSQSFLRKLKLIKDEELGLDFTLNSISGIKDILFEIKNKNQNYNISKVLKYLSNKYNIFKQKKNNSLNINFSETCGISENNIYKRPNNINNVNNVDNLNNKVIFNNLNIINNNIRMDPSKEFLILQYWLIILNINQQINNLLQSIIIHNFFLYNYKYSNNYTNSEHNYNIIQITLIALLLTYIFENYNNSINTS